MGLGVPVKLCVTDGFFREKLALGKMTKDDPKCDLSTILKHFIINFA